MKYVYHEGGRLESTHRKEGKSAKSTDCVLRAISLALDIPYDEVWEFKLPLGYDDDMKLEEIAREFGHEINRIQTIKKGQKKRMTAHCMPAKGRFILRQAKHWVALVDGKLLDTWDSSSRCIYYAWEIK